MDTADTHEQLEADAQEQAERRHAVQSGYMSNVPVHLHAAEGTHGVLMISPWGIEELCSRAVYRCIAERLAGRGFPVLRFDLPGTADARAYSAAETWLSAAGEVLQSFVKRCNLASVTILAQGAGALVAARLAAETPSVSGCILLAPVASGRFYLREIAAWSNLMKEIYRDNIVTSEDGSLRIAGFVLSSEIQSELKGLSTTKELSSSSAAILLLRRPNHPGDEKLADEIAAAGHDVVCADFHEYSRYVGDPTLSELPGQAIDDIVHWLENRAAAGNASASSVYGEQMISATLPLSLASDTAVEEILRFGDGETCFGVLTTPQTHLSGVGFLFLNSGYDHHVGWARCHVDFARNLVKEGHLSLRIDASGIGEAGLHDGQDSQILYSDSQIPDVSAAIDVLKDRGAEKIVLVGRCSGAYLAFLSAAEDSRVSTVVLVNTRRFAWDPRQTVDVEIRKPVQPLENYQRKLRDWDTIKSALSSPKKFRTALTKLIRGFYRPFKRAAERHLGFLSVSGRLIKLVHRRMQMITERGSAVVILFGDDDMGRSELEYYFGPAGQNLTHYSGASVQFISGIDHNLTSEAANRAFLDTLRRAATG